MTEPRILGYVIARNEWPLLGAAIMHALAVGLDKVVVLDHASNDESFGALKLLQKKIPDQLSVYRLNDNSYFQEATTILMSEMVRAEEYDWIYIFDADEFLLVNTNIKNILRDIPKHIKAIRYQINQWIAPYDLDESNIDSFFKISQKAIPSQNLNLPSELIAEEIEYGNMNFFDIPFPTKVISRGNLLKSISAGSHFSKLFGPENEMEIESSVLSLAHLPFRSFQALKRKAEQGKSLIDAGFHSGHGWQSQLAYRLQRSGKLEEFWMSHSSTSKCEQGTIGRFSISVWPSDNLMKGFGWLSRDAGHKRVPAPPDRTTLSNFCLSLKIDIRRSNPVA